ncbi:membrane protein insertase YidC [Qipengyuania sediminis]|uniref:membrane protein insertase YidC n=1 Tax=Qipengyuania sediminis TaxID=1532023 RepID=UPI00105936B4|nr:membrane protein insertase YidC [Qipengyuania sediminis]
MNQRNVLLAVMLSALLLLGWDALVGYLYPNARDAAGTRVDTPSEQVAERAGPTQHSRTGGLDPAGMVLERRALKTALAGGNRVAIDAPRLSGSIDLATGTIDDITLKDYRETVEPGSPPVRLFSPLGTPAQHLAEFGFLANGARLPAGPWQADGARLTPQTPVTISKQAGGLTYRIRFSIDENFMIRAEQRADNPGPAGVVVQPYALINRTDRTASLDQMFVHSGPMGVFGGAADYDVEYETLVEDGPVAPRSRVGWTGFTDIYWLSALVPQAGVDASGGFRALGNSLYRADLLYNPVTLAPGTAISRTTQLFAGAKESRVLDAYEAAGIPQFSFAIDWGWFRWFIRPFLWLLQTLFAFTQNFGVAIILLTVVVRALLFPIAQKGFASMAAMKAITPKMKELQTRYKDDKLKQQQEMQALFKAEGVNPLAGCLPLLLQMPILYALYKVFVLAIDMRHQPFVLWYKDLSAPDPAMILNLFGLLPFTPPAFLGIGVLAVLLGVTMWLTFKLNPAPADPIQQQMFAIMPWVLMFAMAPFAAGLLLYWTTSNILTIAQQKYLYSRHPQLKKAVEEERAAARAAASKA